MRSIRATTPSAPRSLSRWKSSISAAPRTACKLTDYWLEQRLKFYEDIGIPRSKIHINDIPDGERAFYSKKTYDLEYEFPFGISELEGIAYRDRLRPRANTSSTAASRSEYFDDATKEKFIPHVVEPSAGVDRTALALHLRGLRRRNRHRRKW